MKKSFFGVLLLVLAMAAPLTTMAQVDIHINIGLPPPVAFAEPPVVIPLPDTYYVYAVPDTDIDLFFWNGWWWRPWQGRWYRSRYYDRGWVHYNRVPSFYYDVDPRWRAHYRDRTWSGHLWHYERIDQQRLQRNWQTWHNNRYWEKKQAWGVQNYRPRPPQQRQDVRRERQKEYQQKPEVRQYRDQRQLQPRQPEVQPQKPKSVERVQQPPRPPAPQAPPQRQQRGPQPQVQPLQKQPGAQQPGPQGRPPQHSQPPEKPRGAEGGHQR